MGMASINENLTLAGCGHILLQSYNWKAEEGGSQVQSQPDLHRKLQANLDYITRPALKTKQTNKSNSPLIWRHMNVR
jgi:hypothetical protein